MRSGLRRTTVITAVLVSVVAATTAVSYHHRHHVVWGYLHGEGVALQADGSRGTLPDGTTTSALLPGSRVLASATDPQAAEVLAAAQRTWLASGDIPGKGTRWESMTRDALLDLHTLTFANGGTAAGWPKSWRYVWPRDASFVAVAFARTGHASDAERELAYLQRVQADDGSFEARYVLDGSGPPDNRRPQSDGTGWSLWAAGAVLAGVPVAQRPAQAQALRGLIERSTTSLLALTDDGQTLPPASSDYRELPEHKVTLGIVGPFLAGLQAAGPLERLLGAPGTADVADRAAVRFAATVAASFGPGYARTAGGHDADAAVTFLLPPFTTGALPGSLVAATETLQSLVRPAGGLAPGSSWQDHVISWTPETTLFALTSAATGNHAAAEHWLDWLNIHRTQVGALPEKVNADGTPAGAAPLAWTDALVLLTVATLEHSSR
jgi:glucoamylase